MFQFVLAVAVALLGVAPTLPVTGTQFDDSSRVVEKSEPLRMRSAKATIAPTSAAPGEVAVDELALRVEGGSSASENAAARATATQVDPDVAEAFVADDVSTDGRVISDVVATEDVQTIGVTWPVQADVHALDIQVRSLVGGTWSGWAPMSVSEAEVDPGSIDAKHQVRGGTDAYWIGDAEAVQIAVPTGEGAVPSGAALSLVGSPEPVPSSSAAPALAEGGRAQVAPAVYHRGNAAAVPAASSAPTVIARSTWGARPASCTLDVATKLVGAVVHHTAGTNTYATVAEAMQQIRNDQAYHMDARGWCDLGYNFVVDKWGNIYEGRAGSLTKAVIGVHASGYNTGTVGVSMLGNFVSAVPSGAMLDSVAQIIGYRLGVSGVSPTGSSTYPSTGVVRPSVIAHRDVAATTCPGDQGYAKMDRIRSTAAVVAGAQANATPVGFWDSMSVAGSAVTAAGWALDADTSDPISVRAYLDGASAGTFTADGARPDIGRAFGLGDAHGFTVTVPASAGQHRLCLSMINVPTGAEVELGCRELAVVGPGSAGPAVEVDVQRFWSPGFGNAHFYTADAAEAAGIRATDRNWVHEGRAFGAYAASSGTCAVGTSAVYRFYSAVFRSHFFTASQSERDTIRRTDPNWTYEGVAYCTPQQGTAGAVALYRFWSPRFGKHFYTASAAEAQALRSGDPNWSYEGQAYTVMP